MWSKTVIAAIKFGTPDIFKRVSQAKNSGYREWVVFYFLAVLCVCPSQAIAQGDLPVLVDSNQVEFMTGKKLDRANSLEKSFWWKDAELRDRLKAFSDSNKIAVMLDRRIDPSTRVTLGVENRTIEQFFWQLSSAAEIGVCRIEDCYYFGPADTVVALPNAINILSRQAKKVRKPF